MSVIDGRLADSMPNEATIEQLNEEKAALQTQNAQLWRLVDKQRAMIVGLQKDLDQLKQYAKTDLSKDATGETSGRGSDHHLPYPTTPKRGTSKDIMPTAPEIIEDYDDVSTTTDQSPSSVASPASQVTSLRRPPMQLDLKSMRSVAEDAVPTKSPLRSANGLRPAEPVREKSAHLDGSYKPMSPALTARMQQVSRSVSPRLPSQAFNTGYDDIERVSIPRRERVRTTTSNDNTPSVSLGTNASDSNRKAGTTSELSDSAAVESASLDDRDAIYADADDLRKSSQANRETPIRTRTPDAMISDARVVQIDKSEARLRHMTTSESGGTLADIAAPYYQQSSSSLPISREANSNLQDSRQTTPRTSRQKHSTRGSPESDYETFHTSQKSSSNDNLSVSALEPSAEFFPSPEKATWQEHSPERPRSSTDTSHATSLTQVSSTGIAGLREPDVLPLAITPAQLQSMTVQVIDQPDDFSVMLGLFNKDALLTHRVLKTYGDLLRLEQALAADISVRLPSLEEFRSTKQTQLSSNRARIDVWFEEIHNEISEHLDLRIAGVLISFLYSVIGPKKNQFEPGRVLGDADLQQNGGMVEDALLEPEQPQDFSAGPKYKEGFLSKRGKNFGGYKERYFVLEDNSLQYFDAPGGSILGSIKLEQSQIIAQSSTREQTNADSDGRNHAFLILEPKKKIGNSVVRHILCANSDSDRDDWVKALLTATQSETTLPAANSMESEKSKKKGSKERQSERRGSARAPSDAHSTLSTGPYTPNNSKRTMDRDEFSAIGYSDMVPGQQPLFESQSQSQSNTATENMDFDGTPTISGPLNGKPIDNNTAWGATTMSTNLNATIPPQSQPQVDKKTRKKSFWTFGKSDQHNQSSTAKDASSIRSPSYNELSFGSATGQSLVFGAPLGEAAAATTNRGLQPAVPLVVLRCVQYLTHKQAEMEEGIYRLSGSNIVIRGLRERFTLEIDIDLVGCGEYFDIHAVAGLLKLYLRELPSSILTRDLQRDFLDIIEMPEGDARSITLRTLVQSLPRENFELLRFLSSHLRTIVDHSDTNKMTLRNVGIVFSPTLNIPAGVFAVFIEEYHEIFGTRGPHNASEVAGRGSAFHNPAVVSSKNPTAPNMLDSAQSYSLLQQDYSQQLQDYASYKDN